MATHRNTWKAGERRLAAHFGTERTPMSGGNSKHTRSDTLHPTLFIERKMRAHIPWWSQFLEAIGSGSALVAGDGRFMILPLHLVGAAPDGSVCIHTPPEQYVPMKNDRGYITRLFEKTRALALKENKTPLLALTKKGSKHTAIVIEVPAPRNPHGGEGA